MGMSVGVDMVAVQKPTGGYNLAIPKRLAYAMGWKDKRVNLLGEIVIIETEDGHRFLGLLLYRKEGGGMEDKGSGVRSANPVIKEILRQP